MASQCSPVGADVGQPTSNAAPRSDVGPGTLPDRNCLLSSPNAEPARSSHHSPPTPYRGTCDLTAPVRPVAYGAPMISNPNLEDREDDDDRAAVAVGAARVATSASVAADRALTAVLATVGRGVSPAGRGSGACRRGISAP